jgi:hypothetical protein
MPRRPDPRQASFLDLLAPPPATGPAILPGVDAALAEEVLAAILDILPPGVPTFVREVAAAKRDRHGGVLTDLVVFDGLRHRLRISETHSDRSRMHGARRYTWVTDVLGDWPGFYWDEGREAWVRLPEGWEDELAA